MRRGRTRAATVAGLAAALTLTAACNRPQDLPMPEMAPEPTEPVPMPEEAPTPAGPVPTGTGTTTGTGKPVLTIATDAPGTEPGGAGASEIVRPQLDLELLPWLASRIVPGQDIEITLSVDDEGKVSDADLARATLSAATESDIKRRLASWRVRNPRARGLRFVIVVTGQQLDQARPVPRPPMPEMAPRPVPMPEMAPMPPLPTPPRK